MNKKKLIFTLFYFLLGGVLTANASITIYVNSSSSSYYMYAWYTSNNTTTNLTSSWPGDQFSSMSSTTVNGTTYYYETFDADEVSVIFNTGSGGSQTGDITGITEDTYFSYSGGTSYSTVDISSTSSSDGTTYYLVAAAGAKCKFTPDRTRSGGNLNYSYQNLHLQDFIISATGNNFLTDGYLQFHIEDADGTKYYLTGSNTSLENLSSTYKDSDGSSFNGPISDDSYFDASYNGDAAALYWVPLSSSQTTATDFKIKPGIGQSYTFLWQPSNSGLYLIVNGEEFGDATAYYSTDGTRTSAANYYLIGNFADASAATNIDPYSSDNRRMLTPYYYKDGDEYGGSMTDCDSIVYKIEVARPSTGWSELYLDLVNESDFNSYSSSSWSSNESAWAKVIRPEATWSSSGAAYALDATALTGGLMRNENASYQSLNPVVSDDIDSYVFTMNASTSTYSIRFVSAASNTTTDDDGTGDGDDDDEEETEETASHLYIFGTAVGSSEGSSTTSDNWSGANAFKLTYDSGNGYYYYAGSDGATETAIPMTAAGVFAFVTDMDFSKGYYTEDGNLPPTLIEGTTEDGTTTYTSTETTAYSANTGGGFYETQYVNMLGTNRTAGSAAYSEDLRTITWGLPSGDYYIRFYVGATIGEYAKNLYTVRRSYTLLRPDAEAVTVENTDYTTFKVFCDYNAVVVPSDVVVLYVPEITSALTENTDNSSDYTTYDLELKVLDFGDNARVLPANTPVILAMTTERSSDSDDSDDTGDLESSTITMDYYSDPTSTLNSTTTAMTPSIPYEAAPEKTADDGKSYNFFFGYRKLSDTDKKPTIGFYLPISGGYSAINGAYLNLSSDYLGSSEESEESAKEAVLVFYSDLTETDETDGSETTGISNALAADDADADGAYYTLQGMRIAKPTVKGIYIRNGKKTVVR